MTHGKLQSSAKKRVMLISKITGLCFLDINQKTFQFRKSSTNLLSLHMHFFFSLLRIRKVYSLMIHKYFMHFVSVRGNQNVNVRSLIIAATCNKRILPPANF